MALTPSISGLGSSLSMWGQSAKRTRLLVQNTMGFQESRIMSIRTTSGTFTTTVYPIAMVIQDTIRGTLIEGLREDISGNVEFNRSGGTVQFFSGNTSLTRTETAARSGAFAPLGFITARLGTTAIKIPYFAT